MKNFSRDIGLLTLTTATAFILSTGITAAAPAPKAGDLESLGTAQSNNPLSTNLTAEIHETERDDSEAFLSVTWSIENIGNRQEALTWLKDGSYLYYGQNFAGVTAVDPEGDTRYHPIMDSIGACLCSGERNNEFIATLDPGDKVPYWSMFSVPTDVDTVTIEIPGFEPIEDIPIS